MKELSMFSKFWKTIKDDLWIVVLDIIAVNAAYLLALTVRYYINNDYFPDASSRVVLNFIRLLLIILSFVLSFFICLDYMGAYGVTQASMI